MSNVYQINSCEVCGSTVLDPVLDLGSHPMCDDLVKVDDQRVCEEYPIEILFCNTCKTAHQKYQINKETLFPQSYHYRSRFTADVLKGMESLVEDISGVVGSLENKVVVDIGSNDGSLLGFFKSKGAITVGVEPTSAAKDSLDKGHTVYNEFFCETTAQEIINKFKSVDVITFTNVFAHIENLPRLIESLKIMMSPQTVVVIENHYLGSVLDMNQFDTFYHEHPRTYSLNSFKHIAECFGKSLIHVGFPSRYGGNIRAIFGESNSQLSEDEQSLINEVLDKENNFGAALKQMAQNVEQWKEETSALIKNLNEKHGKIAAKAFPGRAAILVKLLGLDHNMISEVYEKPGSMKIGHYLPGTRIPIQSDLDLFEKMDEVPVILNLAWHIPNEIKSYLEKNGFKGELYNIAG